MSVTELSIQMKNQPGQLEQVTATLAQAKVNIRGIAAICTGKVGWVRMVVDDVEAAEAALEDRGITVESGLAVALMMPDEPGGLDRALRVIAQAGINIDYIYTCVERNAALVMVILGVQAPGKVEKLLSEHGLHLVGGSEK